MAASQYVVMELGVKYLLQTHKFVCSAYGALKENQSQTYSSIS